MDNARFLKAIIIGLLLLNFGMLGFLLSRRPPGRDGRPPEPKDIIIERLKLDAAQQGKFAGLRDEHQRDLRATRERNTAFRKKLYEELAAPQPEQTRIAALADSISLFQKEAELATFDHFKKLRAICRPEQQAEFDRFIGEKSGRPGKPFFFYVESAKGAGSPLGNSAPFASPGQVNRLGRALLSPPKWKNGNSILNGSACSTSSKRR